MPARERVVLASANAGKVAELQALLGTAVEILPQSAFGIDPIPETGQTFLENALLKARHAAALSGLPAIADDSGLEVDALGGAPGVHSARYAGESATDAENVAKLLAQLSGLAAASRTARFRCVLVLVRQPDDRSPAVAEGTWHGRIALLPRGHSGFGYDPVFEDEETGRTAAELAAGEKNERSHRGQAARLLRRMWQIAPIQ